MTATNGPEYIGGPLCGNTVRHVGAPEITIARPRIGGTCDGRGTYVYARTASGDFALVADVGATS